MPVIAAHPVAAPANNPRMCNFCLEFVPAGYSVICVHGYREEPDGKKPWHMHLHPWSVALLDPKIRAAYEALMGERGAA